MKSKSGNTTETVEGEAKRLHAENKLLKQERLESYPERKVPVS